MKRIAAALLAAFAVAAMAQPFEAKGLSASTERCLEQARTGGAVAHCLGIEQGQQENRVDAAYGRLFETRDDNGRIDLRLGQRRWEALRADYCDRKYSDDLERIECMAMTAKARADRLEAITSQSRR